METITPTTDHVILVDTQDRATGFAEKVYAHRAGLCHRAFSIFIVRINDDGQRQLLLQQRSTHKYHTGGLWTNTCCSHPRPGETVMTAAARRLQEEMGLQVPSLETIGAFHYTATLSHHMTENEYDHVLLGYTQTTHIPFNHEEVSNIRWVTCEALETALQQSPHEYTPWLKPAFLIVKEALKQAATHELA